MNQWTKKITIAAVFLSMTLPSVAFAQTSTTSVAALLAQIQALQTQIVALQAQQHTLVVEQKNVVKTFARTLKEGITGDDVKMLQALLASDPSIYPEGQISGFYGRLTAAAVKRFQKKHEFDQVGNVGPKTLKKLKELLEGNPLEVRDAEDDDGDDTGSNGDDRGKGKKTERVVCHKIPPGHLIAKGWLKKEGNEKPLVPECQKLPEGIAKKLPGTTTTPPGNTAPDTTAPVISGVTTSAIATTSAAVSWTTSEPATGNVYFGTADPVVTASSTMVAAGTLGTSQLVTLSGLAASTTYFYVVSAKDAANNV